jgi:glycosyltransferase involved in cell wall biosynthesis
MISVIIATNESEQLLVPTLAALVPGAMAGLVREVIVADAGSRDGTAAVADVAGCLYVVTPGPLGARLKAAALSARAPWLMFLRPGSVPDVTWVHETNRFILDAERMGPANAQAAVLRYAPAGNPRSTIAEALALITSALGARPRPEQGLLISKAHYETIGGHRADSSDAEMNLLRRLGRRRVVLLRTSVTPARR